MLKKNKIYNSHDNVIVYNNDLKLIRIITERS